MKIVIGTFSQKLQSYIEENFNRIKALKGDERSIEIVVKLFDKNVDILKSEPEFLEDIEILVTYKLTCAQLMCFPKLKGIVVPMTGLDNFEKSVLEVDGIQIANAHSLAPFVAERAVGIAMTLLGKIHMQDSDLKQGIWSRAGNQNQWTSLRNKKIGIYGYGVIGQEIEKLLKPYHPEIYIIDRKKAYSKNLHLVDDLEELATQSEILFIAVPRNEETEGTVNQAIFEKLRGGHVINVGRGAVVNEQDLFEALRNQVIHGYGSDVWFNYPDKEHKEVPVSAYDLSQFESVVMTPHNSWNTDEQGTLVHDEVIENILKLV